MTETTSRIMVGGVSLGFLFERLGLHQQVLIIFSVLLAIDMILWIAHAYVKDKRSVTSKELAAGVFKKVSRVLIVPLILLTFKGLGIEEVDATMTIVLSAFILSEFYSTIRHIVFFNTKKEMPEMDAFEYVIKTILAVFKPKMTGVLTTKSKKKK